MDTFANTCSKFALIILRCVCDLYGRVPAVVGDRNSYLHNESFTHCDSSGRVLLLLLLLLLLLFTAVGLSLGGSSPYTSTDKTNKNKYT